MSSQVLIDARHSAWPDFVDALTALGEQLGTGGSGGQVLAPRGCRGEAQRLVRDLDLAEHIVVAEAPRRSVQPVARGTQRRAGLTATLLGMLGLQPGHPRRPTWE